MSPWIWSNQAENDSEARTRVSRRVFPVAAIVIISAITVGLILYLNLNDRKLHDLRREFHRMVEEMDRQELVPHNPILWPAVGERVSNPFALHDPSRRHDALRRPQTQPTQLGAKKSQPVDTQERKDTK